MSLKNTNRTAKRIISMVESGVYNVDAITNMINSLVINRDNKIRHLEKRLKPTKFEMTQKKIAGSLRDCINTHGPITKEWIGSASKRIYQGSIYTHNEE